MQLEEMQRSWQAHEQQLERLLQLNRAALRDLELGGARSALARLRLWLGIELVLHLAVLLWLAGFAASQFAALRFAAPAMVLAVLTAVLVATVVRQLAMAGGIDYAAPVVSIQRQVEQLRQSRIRSTRWTLLLAPLVWTPLSIVALQSWFQLDAWLTPGVPWLLANALFGGIAAPALWWLSRWLAARRSGSPLLQRLARDIAGVSLAAAQERLAGVAAFERDLETR